MLVFSELRPESLEVGQRHSCVVQYIYIYMQHCFTSVIVGLDALYKDLSIVEPRLLACLDKLGNSQVRELLFRLQVHELEPNEVLRKHIYPILKSAAWKVRTHPAHLCY